MKPPLRIGLVGAGFVTQHHLNGWQRASARARVVAIADPSLAHAQARASAYGIGAVYADAAAMFDAERLDAVDIAAPREVHAELVRMAAARGIPAICQKPLAPTFDEAQRLADDMAAVPGMRLMVHENWRFRPYYRQAAAWLQGGRIGRVVQAQMTLLSSGLLPDAQGQRPALVRQPFMATLQRALVMEVLIHHIDTLRHLLGEMNVAHARIGRSSPAMAGEDHATVGFETAAGASVLLLANMAVHGEAPALADRLLVVGERGSIRLKGDTLSCEGEQPAALGYDTVQCYADSYAATISHFIDALLAGSPFETSPQDNLRTLRLVEDIYTVSRPRDEHDPVAPR
jgi:D-apiose dehydrogenase